MNNRWIVLLSLLCLSTVFADGVDPTRPPDFTSANPESNLVGGVWELGAIFISPQKKIAVINGQSVKVGDRIQGATVFSIEPNVVQLDGSSGRISLILLEKIWTQRNSSKKE